MSDCVEEKDNDLLEIFNKFEYLSQYTTPLKEAEREIVGREDEIQSILAAFARPELCNVILLAEAGSGKSITCDTPIAVADNRGYIEIGNIKVGDYVYGEDGQPTKVVGVYPQGELEVYEVVFKDGSKIRCNDEHLWNVRNKWEHHEKKDFKTKTLASIIEDFDNNTSKDGHKAYIPMNEAIVRDEIDYSVHPYVVGAFIGDGCLRDKNGLRLSSNDEFVVKKVADLIKAKGYINKRKYDWLFYKIEPTYECVEKYYQQHDIFDEKEFEEMYNKKSIDKRIPKRYMLGSIKQRFELLQGLMDTDGSISDNDRLRTKFSTNSKLLAEDVLVLVRSLGMRATLQIADRADKKNIEYSVYLTIDDEMKKQVFTLPRQLEKIDKNMSKRNKRKFYKHYDDLQIVEVNKLDKKVDMVCIKVDNEFELFQIGKEHIVTHNTALVQGSMLIDKERLYLEVNLSKMISDLKNPNEIADRLKSLFYDVESYVKETKHEIVLFIDEFHQIVQLSDAAVEVLKPLLADSGTRGIKVVAATTYDEFRKYISENQPLVERLQRMNVRQPDREITIEILKGMTATYGYSDLFYDDSIYEMIYEYTQRYIPSSSQPRKSIKVLDSMIGWHKFDGRPIDLSLLADVIYQSEGVNVTFRVDANIIKKTLDKYVFAQDFATTAIEQRLNICVADLNNKDKPMSSFLFTGSTGVGKTEVTKQLSKILFNDTRNLIRFDMTEYANEDSLERFRTELTARVWERPYSIILLDEIEKACSPVTRILLQVLDDGRLSDINGREVSFINSYIVLTTNAGSEIYETIAKYNSDDDGSGEQLQKYNKVIRRSLVATVGENKFPPELLGRIDTIVPFQPLSEATMERIVKNKLLKLAQEVAVKHHIKVDFDKKVVQYLVLDKLDTDASSGGARAVVAKLEAEVTTAVSKFINKYPNVNHIKVKVSGDMASDNKLMLESQASIEVVAIQ